MRLLLTIFLASTALTSAMAGDWPQILGPNRNGVASEEKLANSWPGGGPKVLWQKNLSLIHI